MKFGRRALLSAAVVAASFALAVLYNRLPDRVSTHWEASPFLVAGVAWLLVSVIVPRMVRRRFSIEPSDPAAEMGFGRIQPFSAGLVGASLVLTIVVYGRRPAGLPTPWDVAIFPVVVGFVWLYSMTWPRISSCVDAEAARRAYERNEVAALGVVLLAGILRFGAFGPSMRVIDVSALCFGFILIWAGNVMGKIPHDDVSGIRTPWTLGSPEVWLRTHRVGGKLTMLAGALIIVADRADVLRQWLLPILTSAIMIPWVISYFVSRRLEEPKAG